MVAIILPDAVAQGPVRTGSAELFNPTMLIGRHRLACQLAANPIVFLGHDDLFAGPGGGQSRGNPSQSATDNDDICS
jgi:hypothetical protein